MNLADFNYQFQRTWVRIPATVKPLLAHAFLFYLKALNSKISVITQSMGGNTLPNAYIAIRDENCLIQARDITPRPPMPLFLEIQPPTPIVVPPLAVVPPIPAIGYHNTTQEIAALAQNQEF